MTNNQFEKEEAYVDVNEKREYKELTKQEKVNRFLYKCGALWNNGIVEDAPDIDEILTSLQNTETFDTVLAIVKTDCFATERKMRAISKVLNINEEKLPKIFRRTMNKMSHDATVNIWDYILKVAKREDWYNYTIEGFKKLEGNENGFFQVKKENCDI